MTVVIALAFLFLVQVIFTVVYIVVPSWAIRSSEGHENIRIVIDRIYLVLGLLSNGAAAIGFGLLLAAIFMRRTPEPVVET